MKFVYKLLTYLCGMCIALNWGCHYAGLTFTTIWIYTPMIRLLTIAVHPIKKNYEHPIICIRCTMDCCYGYVLIENSCHKLDWPSSSSIRGNLKKIHRILKF